MVAYHLLSPHLRRNIVNITWKNKQKLQSSSVTNGSCFKYSFLKSGELKCIFPTVGLPVAPMIKSLPAMWETWVRSLGWEDPLEKEMAMNSSILAWRIPWKEGPGGLWSMWLRRAGHD